MNIQITKKNYTYISDFQTNPKEWKQQAGAFFRFRVLIGERECFVKRFIFQPSGWDLVQQLVGETQPYLPEIYAATSEIEAGKLVFYLVTEFLEGDILSDLLTHRKVDMLAGMASNIIQSLQILHLKGFWFADFCEKNLFWASQTHRFVLIDLDSCEPLQTLPSPVPNTPGYVPGQEFAALAITFFKNVVGDTQMQFNTLNGKLLNFAQLLFLSAKVAFFCEKLRQQPQQAYAPMVKENTLAFFQNKYADNPKFLVAVFQKLKEGFLNMELLLQICKKMFSNITQTANIQSIVNTPALVYKPVVANPFDATPLNAINMNWWRGLDSTWKNIFKKYTSKTPETLDFFTKIKNLQTLDCRNNQISDLAPLQNLVNLQSLSCSNNQISDLAPLKNLVNLQSLFCSNNQISDLATLQNLVNLQSLNCDSNQISDLTPLKNLKNLQSLYCCDNQISDLVPLKNLVYLQSLSCRNNQISDLATLQNLVYLHCSKNQISDLATLQNLKNLQSLSCDSNQISDLAPLKNLVNLQELHCYKNQISDLATLQNLVNLQELYCFYNPIPDSQIQAFRETHPNCKVTF